MRQRQIGETTVGALGLGCMGMSWAYGPADDDESLSVLARSLELGVNHWDTADLYGGGENEKLLSRALKGKREQVFLATKFGNVYDRRRTLHQDQVERNEPWIVDGHPEYVRGCIEKSLMDLGVDHVDLYYQHRVDPYIPVEETWGEMKRLVEEGKVRMLGISEASVETIRRAHAVHPVSAVQSELSLWTRDFLFDVVPFCAEIGAAFVAYSPLGRGFLTGRFAAPEDIPEGDWRKVNPRFQGEAFAQNMALVEAARAVAEKHGATPGQVALAWVLAQGQHVTAIPGTKRLAYLEENAGADALRLTEAELALLTDLPPAEGHRYPAMGQRHLKL